MNLPVKPKTFFVSEDGKKFSNPAEAWNYTIKRAEDTGVPMGLLKKEASPTEKKVSEQVEKDGIFDSIYEDDDISDPKRQLENTLRISALQGRVAAVSKALAAAKPWNFFLRRRLSRKLKDLQENLHQALSQSQETDKIFLIPCP